MRQRKGGLVQAHRSIEWIAWWALYTVTARVIMVWLFNNQKIRAVIDTIAKKAVLILGRFTPGCKAILDVFSEALRTHAYVPNSKMKAKETRRGILCQLDDLADMLLEKPDPDNDLLRT